MKTRVLNFKCFIDWSVGYIRILVRVLSECTCPEQILACSVYLVLHWTSKLCHLFQVAGNYTIQLTVTDSDGASNSTLAHLVVNEEIDYPPKANAGEKAGYIELKAVCPGGHGLQSHEHGVCRPWLST